jgi:hypothetical protein
MMMDKIKSGSLKFFTLHIFLMQSQKIFALIFIYMFYTIYK